MTATTRITRSSTNAAATAKKAAAKRATRTVKRTVSPRKTQKKSTVCARALLNQVCSDFVDVDPINSELGIHLHEVDDCSDEHKQHKHRMRVTLSVFCSQHPKFQNQMKLVNHNGVSMPLLFAACVPDGIDDASKIKLANSFLVEFSASLRMKKPRNGCPFYQPSTHAQMLRTLLSAMQESYGWTYTLDGTFNFKGGVKKVTTKLFQARIKKYEKVRPVVENSSILYCLLTILSYFVFIHSLVRVTTRRG